MSKKKMKRCKKCKGACAIAPKDDPTNYVICPECNGKGEVEKINKPWWWRFPLLLLVIAIYLVLDYVGN